MKLTHSLIIIIVKYVGHSSITLFRQRLECLNLFAASLAPTIIFPFAFAKWGVRGLAILIFNYAIIFAN